MSRDDDVALINESRLPHLRGRKLNFYESKDPVLTRSRKLMVGVDMLPAHDQFSKNLLVVGTGRCGTEWLSKTFMQANLSVPHECVGELGTVSNFFHTDHHWYPYLPWARDDVHRGRKAHVGERLSDFKFRHIVHIVRHPLKTVASMIGAFSAINYHWAYDCGVLKTVWDLEPSILVKLHYWRDVVKHCESFAHQTVPLNVAVAGSEWWHEMLERSAIDKCPRPVLPPRNKSSGFNKRVPMTWDRVKELSKDLHDELREMVIELKLE